MALLAQPKRKEKYGFDPRNTNWASDDNKFGQKLMEKMGWEKGKGLGANEDGIVDHIKASYKSDTRGLGCTPKDADAWIAHQDDFNDLLKVLNEDSSREPEKANSSKENHAEGKKRFYGRFARGRVQTLRSTEDLDCIMGRRKTSEPSTPVTQSATNSDDEEKETDLKTVTSSFSVQEYFAKKMKELKSRRTSSYAADEESTNLHATSLTPSAEGKNCTKTKPVYGAVCFSYNDVEKSLDANTDVSKESGWHDVSESDLTDKQNNNGGEKRKKRKGKTCDTEEPCDDDNGNSLKIAKRKRKKLKQEAVSREEGGASLHESFSHVESKDKNSESERELVNDLPDLENSVIKKSGKSKKRKKNDTSETVEEDESKEMNKRKRKKSKVENNLADECLTSVKEISSPLESKLEAAETEDGTSVRECDKSLKKKRERSKREAQEMNDTRHSCSLSTKDEETKSKSKKKRRKVEDECVGDDCHLEDTETKSKKKKKKKREEEKETKNILDCSNMKERKKSKKEADITDKTSEETLAHGSTGSLTDNILSEHVEEQGEVPDSKKKKKKKTKVEKAEIAGSIRQSDTNQEHEQEIDKSNHLVGDDKLPEEVQNTFSSSEIDVEARQDLSKGMLKKKRKEKKKRRQLKKDLSDSFPGSNFGELEGYVPMPHLA